jgi:hypothetical protein
MQNIFVFLFWESTRCLEFFINSANDSINSIMNWNANWGILESFG